MATHELQSTDRTAPIPLGEGAATSGIEPEGDAPLTEDRALAELKNRDLTPEAVERIGRDLAVMKSRKVRLALASHPRTPRRMALRIIRELYTFELRHFALMPTAVADLKRVADELLLTRLPSITLGERISLARRSSATLAGAMLLDKEKQVWQPALENPRLTEAAIVKALQRAAGATFVEAVCHHPKWSLRQEVRVALLRNAHTPLAKAIDFARRIPPRQLRDILHASRLPEKVKSYLRKDRAENKQ
ncbi:MAG TPA: hypothetical protein VE377_00255 [Candidatus Dormibacteraeota bacterium]|nr:hypothetical protein [Candidatus Dormibacteraeota bacterium]